MVTKKDEIMITKVLIEDYEIANETAKLKNGLVSNYYFKVNLLNISYVFSSTYDLKKISYRHFVDLDLLYLIYDNHIYLFNYNSGQILLTLSILDSISKCYFTKKFLFIICEMCVYQIELKSGYIYNIETTIDVITDAFLTEGKIVLHVFESPNIELIF